MKLSDRTRLTGKASFDFLIKNGGIGHLQDSVQNALIVDWFDSVGIYIEVTKWNDTIWQWNIDDGDEYPDGKDYSSRTEATNAAIKKANELYNSVNK
jgi:hypothetical protein